jgi:hypothetical protein
MAELASLPEILATGDDPEDRKRVVRSFLAEVKVDHAKGQATLRWYRMPHLASVRQWWWRRWESNPRPGTLSRRRLRR